MAGRNISFPSPMATAKLQRCLVLQAQATLHQPLPQHHGKGHRLPARLSAPEPDSPRRWAQQKVTVRVGGNGASGRPSSPRRRRHLPPSSPMPKQGTRKPPHHDWKGQGRTQERACVRACCCSKHVQPSSCRWPGASCRLQPTTPLLLQSVHQVRKEKK